MELGSAHGIGRRGGAPGVIRLLGRPARAGDSSTDGGGEGEVIAVLPFSSTPRGG